MKVLIAGGGTGGHVYIGIALAQELRRKRADTKILFVGTRRGLESRIVPPSGFSLEFIDSAGLKGMSLANLAHNLAILPRSLLQSRALVRRWGPGATVGLGGYASGPVVLASWWHGVPTMIIEPNAYPGLANRWLSGLIQKAALAHPEAMPHFGNRGVLTGIPVREEFHAIPRREHHSGELTLLLYGGSQGSHALNVAMGGSLPALKCLQPGLQIIHQTGEKDLEAVQRAYQEAGVDAGVCAFLPRIYEDFARADMILCRAGAGTVAELSVAGRAALLVPFPAAADDHQTKNAQALQKAGAARMLRESELTPQRLAEEIRFFLHHPEEIEQMEEAARRSARPDAVERIADLVFQLR